MKAQFSLLRRYEGSIQPFKALLRLNLTYTKALTQCVQGELLLRRFRDRQLAVGGVWAMVLNRRVKTRRRALELQLRGKKTSRTSLMALCVWCEAAAATKQARP